MLQATCTLQQSTTVTGTLFLYQKTATDKLNINGVIAGLTVGDHGFHVHELAAITSGCAGAGGHYNAGKVDHGAPGGTVTTRHTGDFGNLTTAAGGSTFVNYSDTIAKLSGVDKIVGRAIVLHAGADDLGVGTGTAEAGSKASGNAGARVACCVITEVKSTAVPTGGMCDAPTKGAARPTCAATSCCGSAKKVFSDTVNAYELCQPKATTKVSVGKDSYVFTCIEAASKIAASLSAALLTSYMMV